MSNSFYAMIFRQKHIKRWGLMRNSSQESLSEHTMETAVLAHALALIGNKFFGRSYIPERAAALALYHDAPEVLTGDLPTPIKYFSSDIRSGYAEIERHAVQMLLGKLPDELKDEYRELLSPGEKDEKYKNILKAADKLCAYIKCIEEEKCGNSEFKSARISTERALESMACPELEYFMKEMLPEFGKNIDEL